MVLAKLLKIPPALLALDWHFLLDQADTTSTQIGKSLRETMSRTGTDAEVFNLYQDLLVIGWECTFKGGQKIASSIDKRLEALVHIAHTASALEQEQWLSLLCRFYQLSTRFAQRRMDTQRSLRDAQEAIDTATQLNDTELLASAFFWRARLHLEQEHHTLAREDADAALLLAERVRSPLKGNIYLVAAEIYAPGAKSDTQLRKQCDKWHEKVANIVYRGGVEDDGTFVKLNSTTMHHERAKTLTQLGRFREARNELNTAWKTLSPDLIIWQINLFVTEARLYLAENNLEGSSRSAIEAFKLAKSTQAQDKETQVRTLYLQIKQIDTNNPYACNLGMQLDLY
jgi:hypothetical protein